MSAWLHCPGDVVNEAPVILMSVCLGHFQPSVFESSSQLLLNLFAQNLSEKIEFPYLSEGVGVAIAS